MKREYCSPSLDEVRFDTQKVLFDTSDIFHDKDGDGNGDETIIKPFG